MYYKGSVIAAPKHKPGQPLSTWALYRFASPNFAIYALALPLAAILPPLYAELGISLATVGLIFMIARFFDVFTDPLFGIIGDRVRTRWGRRRPAIALGVPILLAGTYPLFFPGQNVSALGLLLSLFVMYAGWTMLLIAHIAWSSELSADYDQRTRIMGARQFCGLAGATIVLIIPTLIDYFSPNADMLMRTHAMGTLIMISLPILFLVAIFAVDEPEIKPAPQPEWKEGLKSILSNIALRRLLSAQLLLGAQSGINGAVHFFFIIFVLGLPKAASLFLMVIFMTGFLCVPLFVRLSARFGKHRTLCVGALQSATACALLFVIPNGGFWWAFVVYSLIGVGFGGYTLLMRSMMADVIDQDNLNIGTERSALFYSTLTLSEKVGGALGLGIILIVLDAIGFDAKAVNDEATLDSVRLVVAAAPTLVMLAVAVIMWKFPIGREKQQELRAKIEQARLEAK